MSVRVVLAALQRRGGQATIKELQQDHPLAGCRCGALVRQGYIERVAQGVYRLTELGLQVRV